MKLAVARRNDAVDALKVRLNNGYIRIYSGEPPADADTAPTGNTLLAELRFAATAFGAASGGQAAANPIAGDAEANADGVATWGRLVESDGTTVWADIRVSNNAGDGDLKLVTTQFVATQPVNITSLTLSIPASA